MLPKARVQEPPGEVHLVGCRGRLVGCRGPLVGCRGRLVGGSGNACQRLEGSDQVNFLGFKRNYVERHIFPVFYMST